ncbi:MAG: type II toxin-antitoxin system YoeB family toxin [Ekhidna sp.]|nr:type II toxin-antitoxin system YoeB family toxin [Ekhidna sp.]
MELICNELSFYPLADKVYEVENRFQILLKAFKAAKLKFGFKKIRFQNNLSDQSVTEELNFVQAVSLFSRKDLKRTVLTFLKPPYFDDLTEAETDRFLESDYRIVDQGCPTDKEPFGLPVAHIKGVPAISIQSHSFWENNSIKVQKYSLDPQVAFNVPNICVSNDCNSKELSDWTATSLSRSISTKDELIRFLNFNIYKANIQDDFFKQLSEWKDNEYKIYQHTLALMKDVEIHPFSGGMGKTENLKNRGKECSKRITQEHG